VTSTLARQRRKAGPGAAALGAMALVLFLAWSNSFVAVSFLLGREGVEARFDWISLTVARFLPAAVVMAPYVLFFRCRESWTILKGHPVRLLVAGLLAVPSYNLALYYGQQHGVPAPIASVTTTLAPLFLMVLSALFLGERLTWRRAGAFAVALTGVVLIGRAKQETPGDVPYSLSVLVLALAPLSWSLYTVISKPLTGRVSSVLWTYLSVMVGTVPLLFVLPFRGGPEMAALDATGWGALLFLSLLCTVLGYALWMVLLRHLPASTLGFTVFLNPPLTTASKWGLSLLLPAMFTFRVLPMEWVGGGVVLTGLLLAVMSRRTARLPARGEGG